MATHHESSAAAGFLTFSFLCCLLYAPTHLCGLTQRLLLPLSGCEQRATSHPHVGAAVVTLFSPSVHGIKCILSQVLSPAPCCATNIPCMDFLVSLLLSRCKFLVQAEIRSVWSSQNAGSDWSMLSSDDL